MLRTTILDLRTAIIAFVLFSALLGIAYPYAITGIAQGVFNRQANGSFVKVNGQPVGSSLVGQNFSGAQYFHPRPSAAGSDGYDASASSGSNLGPSSKALVDRVKDGVATGARGGRPRGEREGAGRRGNHLRQRPRPAHLARLRGAAGRPRCAERNMTEDAVRSLVHKYTDGSTLGLLGEPRVNVLRLNLALDAVK